MCTVTTYPHLIRIPTTLSQDSPAAYLSYPDLCTKRTSTEACRFRGRPESWQCEPLSLWLFLCFGLFWFHRVSKNIGLNQLVALGWAFLHTYATRCTFRVVSYRDAINHRDALLGTRPDAGFALDAANLAALDDGRFNDSPVGAQHDRPLPRSGDRGQYLLRAFLYA